MPFAIASMTWKTKETTVSHDDFDLCPIPWRAGSVRCKNPPGHDHSPTTGPWLFGPYTPTPEYAVEPDGMNAKLVFDPARITEANRKIYEKCFKDGVQLKLTVRFNDGTLEPLTLNLRWE